MESRVHYDILLKPNAHLFNVVCTINKPIENQIVSFPRWLPGSYLIREFSKHVNYLKLDENSDAVLKPIDNSSWEISNVGDSVIIHYEVYGFDPSVRGLYLDTRRGFINNSRLCLVANHLENELHTLNIKLPEEINNWKVATTLSQSNLENHRAYAFKASSYLELIDHPIELGEFKVKKFNVESTPHSIVISGKYRGDDNKLKSDVEKICSAQMRLFKDDVPFNQYIFLLNLVGEGYGGLEHSHSCALQAKRECMPFLHSSEKSEDYISLLGLFSHEYFHAWNIKRIKPQCFVNYNLSQATPTSLLWVFEGFTAYYDELMLVRSGVITKEAYLKRLSQSISRYTRTQGRYNQTLTDSSYYAWTKFYQPDENSVNSSVSYYLKGSLVALCIDSIIRESSNNKLSLDDMMRWMWKEKGVKGEGLCDHEIEAKLIELGGEKLAKWLNVMLYTTEDIPLEPSLSYLGLEINYSPSPEHHRLTADTADKFFQSSLGVSLVYQYDRCYIQSVFNHSAAEKAGLCAKDELVAIDSIQVKAKNYGKILSYLEPGEEVEIYVFRDQQLIVTKLRLDKIAFLTAQLAILNNKNSLNNLNKWLWK